MSASPSSPLLFFCPVQFFDARRTSGAYQEPVGVFIRRAPVCKYDIKATEIDSIRQSSHHTARERGVGVRRLVADMRCV